MNNDNRIRLAAFDLDGTLLRGDTVCQVIARQMGHLQRMNEIEQLHDLAEVASARAELAQYYRSVSRQTLLSYVEGCALAPGAEEGLVLLRAHEIAVAIISVTWSFAVERLASRLSADYWVGTHLLETGDIKHFWSHDKPVWLMNLMNQIDATPTQVAAIGDSPWDAPMLEVAAHRFYVGPAMPPGLMACHCPDGNILAIAEEIVSIR